MKIRIAILAACASALALAQADVARAKEAGNIPVGVAYKNGQRAKANNPSLGKVKTNPSAAAKSSVYDPSFLGGVFVGKQK
jgi:hypothetical protein